MFPTTSSCAITILSCITLPGINADWHSSITELITAPSVADRIFDIIFYIVVQQEIGLRFFTFVCILNFWDQCYQCKVDGRIQFLDLH